MFYFLVAPQTIARRQDYAFTYHFDRQLPVGTLVRVSVGKKSFNGVVLKILNQKPSFTTKPIDEVLHDQPVPTPLLRLAEWLSDYYIAHFSLALQTILPTGLHKTRRGGGKITPVAKRDSTKNVLNHAQQAAVAAIAEHKTGTLLLHGVTGSGKTQVYMTAAQHALQHGRSAMVLVPEIALTPQLVAEFNNHFKHVVLTHSHMTEAQRHQAWLTVLEATEPLVIIGPRSALFLPVANLGLIVVDEAHEPSYKQEQSPRYSTLRAASVLAKLHNAPLVLGTATPNTTDYYLAQKTNSPILSMPKPAKAMTPPTVQLIDNKRKDLFREHRYVSDDLLAAMRQALSQGHQALVFHNRRGTAPTTLCSNCGWSALCPNCFVPLTLHADQHILLCHLCGRKQAVPPTCPECKNPDIVFKGIGTKLVEQDLRRLFPKANIARFDADNAATETLQHRYQELYDGAIDIAVGTQILAKGLDLPKLTVVGVLQADSGLGLPDYQSEERVYQLLSQVSGRVGRGSLPSTVIIQTYQPEHPAVAMAVHGKYADFYQHTLAQRQTAHFPPFCYLLKLTCVYKTERGAITAAAKMAAEIRRTHPGVEILGPTPAFYERMGDTYRWQLLLKSMQRARLVAIAKDIPQGWQVDIDPGSLL